MAGLLIVLFLVALWNLALTPIGPSEGFQPADNLVPLRSIADTITSPASWTQKLSFLGGNLFVLVPVPVLGFTVKGSLMRLHVVALTALGISAGVEVAQWMFLPGRAGDVDDVLLNVAGALVAAWVLRVAVPAAPAALPDAQAPPQWTPCRPADASTPPPGATPSAPGKPT